PGVDRVLLGLTAVAAGLLQVLRLALLASRRLVAGLVGLAAQLLGLVAGLRPGVGRLLRPVLVAGLDPCAVVGRGGRLLVGLLVGLAGVGVEPAAGEVVVQRVAQRVVPVGDRGRVVTVELFDVDAVVVPQHVRHVHVGRAGLGLLSGVLAGDRHPVGDGLRAGGPPELPRVGILSQRCGDLRGLGLVLLVGLLGLALLGLLPAGGGFAHLHAAGHGGAQHPAHAFADL